MPFTISHVAAALPLARAPLSGSALAIGSMSPDLGYFAALRPLESEFTHSWAGLVTVDLAVSLVLLLVFHAFVVPAVLALAPGFIRERLAAVAEPPKADPWVVVSVLVGGMTHLLLDSFTHADGLMVALIPALRGEVSPGVPTTHFLQMALTGVGLVVLAVWSVCWLARARPRPVPEKFAPARRPWLPALAVVVVSGALAVGNALRGITGTGGEPVVVGVSRVMAAGVADPTPGQVHAGLIFASIGAVTGAFLALVGYGVVHQRRMAVTSSGRLGERSP
ncbi:DUF4184 family protein [Actinokineospora sp. G85]|uniref:DUF4184 family protein n=1 Tax=Actinokineospora sp. G85 TaxID=3406626 RepID=UPI003C78F588